MNAEVILSGLMKNSINTVFSPLSLFLFLNKNKSFVVVIVVTRDVAIKRKVLLKT